jgi:hypothetical protein
MRNFRARAFDPSPAPNRRRSKQREKAPSGRARRSRRFHEAFYMPNHAFGVKSSSTLREHSQGKMRVARTLACCSGTTANEDPTIGQPAGLPMLSPLWHNELQLLDRPEKVSMAGAKSLGFLANFIR